MAAKIDPAGPILGADRFFHYSRANEDTVTPCSTGKRDRDRERHTQRETERDTQRETETETERETETETERHREREIE